VTKEAMTTMDQVPIPGWGIDQRIEDRPGYPLEQEWHVDHDTVGGVPPYTETIPLHGMSGRLRRFAYRYQDWQPRKWMLLMLADRIDVLESALTPRKLLMAGGLVGAGAAVVRRLRGR
jgi:hypothetical protein